MDDKYRTPQGEVLIDPQLFSMFRTGREAWYESPEDVEAGLQWGREKEELLKWLRRQMGRRLTARERRCVEMYYFKGMTLREIGNKTKTDPSSACRALARAVRKLRASAERGDGQLQKFMPKASRFRAPD